MTWFSGEGCRQESETLSNLKHICHKLASGEKHELDDSNVQEPSHLLMRVLQPVTHSRQAGFEMGLFKFGIKE